MQGPGPQRWESEKRSWREAGRLGNRGKGVFCLLLPRLSWGVTLLPKSSAIRGGSICYWTSAFLEGLTVAPLLARPATAGLWNLSGVRQRGCPLSASGLWNKPCRRWFWTARGPQLFRPLDGSFRELCSTQAASRADAMKTGCFLSGWDVALSSSEWLSFWAPTSSLYGPQGASLSFPSRQYFQENFPLKNSSRQKDGGTPTLTSLNTG